MEMEFVLNSKKSFYKKGYFKTKICDIAGKSGVSIGTLYRAFDSKEELLVAVLKHELELYQTETSFLALNNFNFTWKISQLCHISLGLLKENPDLFILLNEVNSKRDKFSSKAQKWIDMVWTESKGVFIKSFPDIKEKEQLLIGSLFENQFRIYFKHLLMDQVGIMNRDSVIFMNLKKESHKLSSMIISSCESLNILKPSSTYDPLTKAYSSDYIHKKVRSYMEQEQGIFFAFMMFKWPEDEEQIFFFKDSILRYFVSLLKEEFRNRDLIGRLCENKFVLVIPFDPNISSTEFSFRVKKVLTNISKKHSVFKADFFKYSGVAILKSTDFEPAMRELFQNANKI